MKEKSIRKVRTFFSLLSSCCFPSLHNQILFFLLYDFYLSFSSFPFLLTSLLCPRLPFRKVKSVLEFIGPCWPSHFKRTVSFYTEDSHSKVPWLIPKNHWNNKYFCQNHTCCNNWLILFLILWNTAPQQTMLLCHNSACVCVCVCVHSPGTVCRYWHYSWKEA